MGWRRNVVLVHSSDLHVGQDTISGSSVKNDPLAPLREVLAAARSVGADLVVLAGDTFDHNRQPQDLIAAAAEMMAEFAAAIVILPGNHDPLTEDSVYRRARLAANIRVLGLTVEDSARFPALELEIRGKAHLNYADMHPLPERRPRESRWRITAAHGHYVENAEPGRLLGSWIIRREDLLEADSDYVALGHWNCAARVGDGAVNAYYSGSPEHARTVNVVRLLGGGGVEVARVPLRGL